MKAFFDLEPGVQLRYRVDDFTDPWRKPETVVCVHGFGESSEAWRAWVPHLARHYRVIRIDQRGFGESTPMPEEFPWTLDVLVGDLERVVRDLGNGPVHLVAAKIAGPIILHFAATRAQLARSVTLVGSLSKGPAGVDEWLDFLKGHDMEDWARKTMPPRLGSDMPPEALEWWVQLTGRTPKSTALGLLKVVSGIDVTHELPQIQCPALVITTDSARRPVAKTREWQSRLPNSRLVALPGDAYHPAASAPDACARATLEFLQSLDTRKN